MPYYIVTDTDTEEEPRLIKASNQAQAIRHVTTPRFACRVATADDIVKLVERDVEVETARTTRQ